MSHFIVSREAEEELLDLHRGLHLAMDELIRNKHYNRAEEILRQVDFRMSELLNNARQS